MERTLVMIKPDGIQRRLVGEIIGRFERKGLKIVGLKLIMMTKELAQKLYKVHKDEEFYPYLIKFSTSGPSIVMALKGKGAIDIARSVIGHTLPERSLPGSIRGNYAIATRLNLAHGSDSPENADFEIGLFFKEGELIDYPMALDPWLYGGKGVDK